MNLHVVMLSSSYYHVPFRVGASNNQPSQVVAVWPNVLKSSRVGGSTIFDEIPK